MNRRRHNKRSLRKDDAPPTPATQTPSPEADASEEQARWQALQQSIGNAAVARMQSVQDQAAREDATPVDDTAQSQISAAKGTGDELAHEAQQALAPSFGAGLSDVRVHTDEASGRLVKQLGARAFTQGSDVFFAPGEYNPESGAGRATLAHELTHVMRGSDRIGVVHCLGEDIPMPFAPGQRFADEGPQMSLADPGGGVSMAPEWGASEGGPVREMVGGVEYTATTAFEWELGGNVLNIRVPIAFSGAEPKREWFSAIRSTWNHFDIVNTETGERVMLIFEPVEDPAGYPVQVLEGQGRSNESQWYLGDTRTTTAPHEFGHMLGLQDEYQVTAGHYEGITGEETPDGDWLGGFGGIDDAATALHDEIVDTATADQAARIYNVVLLYGLQQGSYAQAVALAYQGGFGADVVKDLVGVQKLVTDPKGYIYWTIEALTYSSGSIMGNAEATAKSIDHEHGAQPRHVRRFAQLVASAYGGNWRPEMGR